MYSQSSRFLPQSRKTGEEIKTEEALIGVIDKLPRGAFTGGLAQVIMGLHISQAQRRGVLKVFTMNNPCLRNK